MSRSNKDSRAEIEFEEEEEDGENWLASFSDLMSDLLALFVILFSFAMMNQASANHARIQAAKGIFDFGDNSIMTGGDAMISGYDGIFDMDESGIFDTFEGNLSGGSGDNTNGKTSKNGGNGLEGIPPADLLSTAIKNIPELSTQIELIKMSDKELVLRVGEATFFDSGRADIRPESEVVLQEVTSVLTRYAPIIKMIRIEGHTDNRPITSKTFASNWELSVIRAVNILKWIVAHEETIESSKFSAVGYSEFHPIADNTIPEGRAQNRRVDFVIEMLTN